MVEKFRPMPQMDQGAEAPDLTEEESPEQSHEEMMNRYNEFMEVVAAHVSGFGVANRRSFFAELKKYDFSEMSSKEAEKVIDEVADSLLTEEEARYRKAKKMHFLPEDKDAVQFEAEQESDKNAEAWLNMRLLTMAPDFSQEQKDRVVKMLKEDTFFLEANDQDRMELMQSAIDMVQEVEELLAAK